MPQDDRPSLSERLLNLLQSRPVTAADRQAVALHLLDWQGCAIAGAQTGAGRRLATLAGGAPLALAGQGNPAAAFALGGLGSLLEMDDVHRAAILHPGPVVMAAALAICATEAQRARLPDAILRGYEAMIRLGAAVGPGHYAQFHNTGTCGGIGAAVAAAHLLGLDRDATVWAIGHAMSTAGGLWQCRNEPGETKHLHVAEATRRGVQAALCAAAGLRGPRRILEGPQGFFAGMAREGRPEAMLDAPDAPWQLHETSFKPWPACRHAHPAIDAALLLRDRLGAALPDRITITSYGDAVLFCDKPAPASPAEARFSLQHAVAVALRDGPPQLAAFDPPGLSDPGYAALRARTEVAEAQHFTAAYPAHFGAAVAIRTAAGEVLEAEVPDAWGDSENPMDSQAVIAKHAGLCAWAGLAPETVAGLRAAALACADGPAPAALTDTLRGLTLSTPT